MSQTFLSVFKITIIVSCYSEHIAPVLSVVAAPGVVASGGEDSRVIVSSLVTGEVAGRIDHHRGPVTCVALTAAADVLVSGENIHLMLFVIKECIYKHDIMQYDIGKS